MAYIIIPKCVAETPNLTDYCRIAVAHFKIPFCCNQSENLLNSLSLNAGGVCVPGIRSNMALITSSEITGGF
jgi:hypothetical protein